MTANSASVLAINLAHPAPVPMEMEQAAVGSSGMMPGACSVTVQITAFMLRGPSTGEVVTKSGAIL